VQEGFTSLDEVAYVPLNEMLEIEAFDEDNRERAAPQARATRCSPRPSRARRTWSMPPRTLRGMEGMDTRPARVLATNGITTMDALATWTTEELTEMTGMEAERASKLIMAARAPWFKELQATQA
jgi:N utilization substance protein A